MIELQHISRLLCSALAAALLVGCASKEPPGPQVTLQDPEQTPREKWSDAMKILRDDLGIKGQKDVPVETARQYGLIAGVSKPTRGNGGSMGDLAFGGVGAALFLIPTGEVMGPWQKTSCRLGSRWEGQQHGRSNSDCYGYLEQGESAGLR
ncbi:hypothetical protein ACFSHR_00570 [Azotobacter chroococcum]